MTDKVINKKKIIEVPFSKGSYDGLSLTVYRQGDQSVILSRFSQIHIQEI